MLELRASDLVPASGTAGSKSFSPARPSSLYFIRLPLSAVPVAPSRPNAASARHWSTPLRPQRCSPLPKGGPRESRGLAAGTNGRKNENDFASELAPDALRTDSGAAQDRLRAAEPRRRFNRAKQRAREPARRPKNSGAARLPGTLTASGRGRNSPPGRAFVS